MSEPAPILTKSDAAAVAEGCYFDAARAEACIRWIEATFALTLYAWQRHILRLYFGWRRPGGAYRFTQVSIWIPKKNGKTWLIAALVGFKLFELKNARIFSAACNAMQAKILLEELVKMCRQSPKLRKKMKPRGQLRAFCSKFRREILNDMTGSRYEALADNVNANDGLIPDVLVIDEIHRMKNAQVDVVDGSTSNNPRALKVYISTAGSGDKTHRSWQKYDYAKRVLSGDATDTSLLAVVYECPDAHRLKGEAIYDLDRLVACNPVLQEVAEKRDQAAREMAEAREIRNDAYWRRFRLNQWIAQDGDEYIDAASYEACEVDKEPDISGADCFVGLDKSGGEWDFHAATFLFLLEDGRVYERHFTFASADRLEPMAERDDRDYRQHVDRGELTLIPADAVTDEFLYNWSKEAFAGVKVKRIAADPYAAAYLLERWRADGHEVAAVQQSNNRLLSPVIDDYANRIRQGRILHAPSELVAWQLSCARKFTTSKDTAKIVKAGSTVTGRGGVGHIDNIDALLNALAALRAAEIEDAAYQDAGIAVVA
jgi:phage terminase large subunit-like protein